MGLNAFTPLGNTVVFTANTAAPTPVQVASSSLGGNQYRVINAGNVTVHLGFAATSALAATNATIPTGGGASGALSIPIIASTDEILSFVPNMYVTGITASGTAVVYITPGDGL